MKTTLENTFNKIITLDDFQYAIEFLIKDRKAPKNDEPPFGLYI